MSDSHPVDDERLTAVRQRATAIGLSRRAGFLRASLSQRRLASLICQESLEGAGSAGTSERALDALEASVELLEGGAVSEAWSVFHIARRESLALLSAEEAILRSQSIRSEVDAKLIGWRRNAAESALSLEDGHVEAGLVEAQRQLDERSNNVYRRLELQAKVLLFLVIGLTAAALALIVAIDREWLRFSDDSALREPEGAAVTILLGAIGSLLSVALSRLSASELPLPDLLSGWLTVLMRPLLGGLSAVVVVIFLESGIQEALTAEGQSVYVFAVVAGFSERLLRRSLESVSSAVRTATSPTERPGQGAGSEQ
ncbi:MAG: hypothetical protein AAGA37_06630 [Actinomycetota bacterium]